MAEPKGPARSDSAMTSLQFVGWVEQSETHHFNRSRCLMGFASAQPILRMQTINCALLDAAVLCDLKENAERGHADGCGSNRQKNVQRRLCAAQPILPGFEIPRGPIAQ